MGLVTISLNIVKVKIPKITITVKKITFPIFIYTYEANEAKTYWLFS